MEQQERLQLGIDVRKLDGNIDKELSWSESEQETDSSSTIETPRSLSSDNGTPRSLSSDNGTPRSLSSDIGTHRSLVSEESSCVTSPRANLLWDHCYDVANSESKTLNDRDSDWRRFSNKTDDDKLLADKSLNLMNKVQNTEQANMQKYTSAQGLPDLIPGQLSLSNISLASSQETLYAVEELDFPPPLPDSDPPILDEAHISELPPPLPATSPPTLQPLTEHYKPGNVNENGDTFKNNESKTSYMSIDDTEEFCSEGPNEIVSDDSSSAAGDISDHESEPSATNYEGLYNVQTHTMLTMDAHKWEQLSRLIDSDDIEAEFDNIIQSLNSEYDANETYVERFAGRRDRYGFILSPVIEAPSPTPSNMSGYSGYSGISCSSPDPFGIFRMSPGPNRGSRQELDLSSLSVKPNDFEVGADHKVPIYQTVQAKKVVIIPEGYGWDSGDDLLSPTGNGEWDRSDNGLSTPPVSTSHLDLTQFGTHITGWKQPDAVIYEEPENYSSDSTITNEEGGDSDSTIDDDSPRLDGANMYNVSVTECESPEKNIVDNDERMNTPIETQESVTRYDNTDETVQTLELSVLEDEIEEIENELKLLKTHAVRNNDLIKDGEQECLDIEGNVEGANAPLYEGNGNIVPLDNVDPNNATQEFDKDISFLRDGVEEITENEVPVTNVDRVSLNSSLEERCRKSIRVGMDQTGATSDDESDTTEESVEDAEDEYSESDSETTSEVNVERDSDLFKARPVTPLNESENESNVVNKDDVSVTELLSPRTAILLSGGMFPEETETSSFTSDDYDNEREVTPDPNLSSHGSGIIISQYTSGDSDDNHKRMTNKNGNTSNKTLDTNTATPEDQKPDHEDINDGANTGIVPSLNTVKIQSPIDFSLLDSTLDTHTRDDIRKSPRIFGRYLSEMNNDLLDEVRSKYGTPEIGMEEHEQERHETFSEQMAQNGVDEFENSFQHVEITDSSNVKPNNAVIDDEVSTEMKQSISDQSQDVQPANSTLHNESPKLDTVSINDEQITDNKYNQSNEIVSVSDKVRDSLSCDTPQNTANAKSNYQGTSKHTNTKVTKSPKKSPALKLKIGHLIRRSSARSKVKRGYVHELSELFDKGDEKQNDKEIEIKISKKPKKSKVIKERAPTPKSLTANENLVIFENSESNTLNFDNDEIEVQDSTEIEATPLQLVSSFDVKSQDQKQQSSNDESSEMSFQSLVEHNTCLRDEANVDDLRMYENHLRETQAYEVENAEYFEDDCRNDLQEVPSSGMTGTSEFTPCLETYSENQLGIQTLTCNFSEEEFEDSVTPLQKLDIDNRATTREHSDVDQDEIQESIDGDTDPEQSEDEEFHKKYFLPGHSYHINGAAVEAQDYRGHVVDEGTSTELDLKQSNDLEVNIKTHDLHSTDLKQQHSKEDTDKENKENIINVKSNEIKGKHPDKPEVDMYNILWRVPWTPVKERRETITAKAVKSSHENTVPKSGYLYNIISRLNKATPANASSVTPSTVSAKSCLTAVQANTSGQNDPNTSKYPSNNSHLTDKSNSTALSEKGEFDFLDESFGEKTSLLANNNSSPRSSFDVSNIHLDTGNTNAINRTATVSGSSNMDVLNSSLNNADISNDTSTDPLNSSSLNYSPNLVMSNGSLNTKSSNYSPGRELLKRKRSYDYDDDPQFKIRYPSSLSRRLYGPYCRLRAKENVLLEDVSERGTTPPTLPQNQNLNSDNLFLNMNRPRNEDLYNSKGQSTLIKTDPGQIKYQNSYKAYRDSFETERKSPIMVTRRTSVDIDLDLPTENLSLDSDGQKSQPDDFIHTCYDVKTTVSCSAQRESIKFNSKAIIADEVNHAQLKPLVCESNFVNVNLQSVINEAKTDKQERDSNKTATFCTGNSDWKLTKLPMHVKRDGVENISEHENCVDNINNTLGVDINSEAVNDDDHYLSLGVHIPSDLPINETTQQVVDMNNDPVSKQRSVSSVKASKPGINRASTSLTTQNINLHQMSSGDAVTENTTVTNGYSKTPTANDSHISRGSVEPKTPGLQHVLEDEKGKLKLWPYSEFDNCDKLPVTLHRVKKGYNLSVKKGMSNNPNNMTVIQSAERSAEMADDRIVHKYQSSSILPADQSSKQIMKAHGDSVQSVLLQDANGNNISEEEMALVLPKIADSISKMDNVNAEEILPGITQSITKLKNGGNLVITTMTRKLEEDESCSSGRGSPAPDYPVLDVDDLERNKIFLVQDSKGELFYVEDVTSESQESAYYSSRNTSESVSDTGNTPQFERISKVNSVGDSGIKDSTAQEILSAMYGDGGVKEMRENEEEWSERTYEYDLPRRRNTSGTKEGYSKDSFKTSYMVEEPGDTMPRLKAATSADKYESSYQMPGGGPWVYDGGMAQSYSQVTQGVFGDDANSVSAMSGQNVDNSGVKTIERYTIEGEAIDYPPPLPAYGPPMVVKSDAPQYSLVKVDVTPKQKDEGVLAQIEAPKPEEPTERPIYKTVAHIKTNEKVPSPPKPQEKKKYKIIASKATKAEEEQETHMQFDEVDYKFTSENVEYTMKPATAEKQYFIKNTTTLQPANQFRSEKQIHVGRSTDEKFRSQIQVQQPQQEVYEENNYSYDRMKAELEQSGSNMRVVRGSYLIKNSLDDVGAELDDNINMFDRKFGLCKDNPLYHSDEDLYRRLEKERLENARRQERLQRDFNHDISFETVDRFSKSKAVKREPEKPRQSLYEMLMSRLSTIDSKDIRQKIDVKHNSEDIYGDPRFLQADGQELRNIAGTNNFETVGEKVDLMLKDGKANITIKVTAERIHPVDLEFNVWCKNQAIVTRTIEVDLLATEQRRRLYYKVMTEPAGGSRDVHHAGPNETVLDSQETLELFSKILGAADGEGDTEDIEVRTKGGNTSRPFSSGIDLLY